MNETAQAAASGFTRRLATGERRWFDTSATGDVFPAPPTDPPPATWLERQDATRGQVLRVLAKAYGMSAAPLRHQR